MFTTRCGSDEILRFAQDDNSYGIGIENSRFQSEKSRVCRVASGGERRSRKTAKPKADCTSHSAGIPGEATNQRELCADLGDRALRICVSLGSWVLL